MESSVERIHCVNVSFTVAAVQPGFRAPQQKQRMIARLSRLIIR